ncbi:protein S100-A10 isoform X2 [Numida meleagris]|uniref:protein S100-A10 isoform X2 n=1 Tax=Numida meleagris TaxID=8996 RepID=UPI000B3D8997|nr:protein S100-A10 isoform X2 [Numida meleagris]
MLAPSAPLPSRRRLTERRHFRRDVTFRLPLPSQAPPTSGSRSPRRLHARREGQAARRHIEYGQAGERVRSRGRWLHRYFRTLWCCRHVGWPCPQERHKEGHTFRPCGPH